MSHSYEAQSLLGRIVNEIEETAIAVILGLMTILTFINVVLRYGFNTGIIWGLEAVTFLFAWLVLFGVSYAVKITAHLGVDAVINLFSPPIRRVFALFAGGICIAYAALVFKGAWDYWAPFAGFYTTTGDWFPTGFDERTRDRAFYMTDQVPMLEMFRWLEDAINYGDEYDKLPRVIPYAMLPFGVALLLYRFIEATVGIVRGTRSGLIVSHEVEDAIDDIAAKREEA